MGRASTATTEAADASTTISDKTTLEATTRLDSATAVDTMRSRLTAADHARARGNGAEKQIHHQWVSRI